MLIWVDDDTTLDFLIEEIIEDGWNVVLAENPDEMMSFLNNADEKAITGIIMDMMMPTGNTVDPQKSKMGITCGLELIRKLKSDDKYKNIPIIIFTHVNEPEVIDYAQKNNIPLLKKQDCDTSKSLIQEIERVNIRKDTR